MPGWPPTRRVWQPGADRTRQGDVFAPRQTARHQAKQATGPVAFAPHRAIALAALMAARSQTQPGGEMLLRRPFAQVGAHLPDQLQEAVVGVRRQDCQILAPAQLGKDFVQALNLRSVGAGALEWRSFDFL